MRLLHRLQFRLESWLGRKRLARDPAYAHLERELIKARKRHGKCAEILAAKRDYMHTAIGWRGLK